MIPENGLLSFEVQAINAIDNELNVPRGYFYYTVQVYYFKGTEKMLMINPETGWPGFALKDHDDLMAFIAEQTVIRGVPLSPDIRITP